MIFWILALTLLVPVVSDCSFPSTWGFPPNFPVNVIVSGGSDGIGAALVDELAALPNSSVLCCARNEKKLLESVRGRPNVHTVVADVSTISGRATLLAEAEKLFNNRLTILVNNVGTNIRKPTLEYTSEDYDKVMDTNIKSCFFLSQQCHKMLKNSEGKTASIVNIGSVVGCPGGQSKTGSIYSQSKAAMNQLTGNLACEWAKDGIRVNCVCPWYTKTPLAEQVLKNEEYLNSVLDRTPMKRIGECNEVARAATFFALPASSYITGQILGVDGGYLKNGFH